MEAICKRGVLDGPERHAVEIPAEDVAQSFSRRLGRRPFLPIGWKGRQAKGPRSKVAEQFVMNRHDLRVLEVAFLVGEIRR